MSRRREPAESPEEESARREEGRRLASSPLGWTLTLVGIAGLVALSFLWPLAALGAVLVLAAGEAADQIRRRRGSGAWLVEATRPGREPDRAWRVTGRRRSAAAVRQVAASLERGHPDPDLPGADLLP